MEPNTPLVSSQIPSTELDIGQYKLEIEHSTPSSVSHPPKADGPREEWKQLELIGEGGFGEVYLQVEVASNSVRAVKSMHKRQLTTKGIDVRRELVNMIAVMDEGELFVRLQGWYEDRTFIYLAMDYIKWGNLHQHIRAYGPQGLGNTDAVTVTTQILRGLVILHERGICHRDLKPENILIASRDPLRVKLADFGISKSTVGTSPRSNVGTIGYLAPEVQGFRPKGYLRYNEYSFAVDMWALGCLVHQMLTSEVPFLEALETTTCSSIGSYAAAQGTELTYNMESFSKYCHGKIPLPIGKLRDLNSEAASFVESLLLFHPDDRPTAADSRYHKWLNQH